MDFELTEEQKDIRRAVQEFTQKEFTKEKALEYDQKEEFPYELWKKACKLGFIGIHFPEEYGGQGFGVFENVLVIEEFCRVDSSIGVALSLTSFASEIILRKGNEDQKKKFLPLVAGGRLFLLVLSLSLNMEATLPFYPQKPLGLVVAT